MSTSISVETKKKELVEKYHFEMTKEIEEDAIDMCNIGTATLMKGAQENALKTAKKLLQRGKDSIEEIAEITELPLDTIKELANSIQATE